MNLFTVTLAAALLPTLSAAQDIVVHSGETKVFDQFGPSQGLNLPTVTVDTLIVEAGGTVRFPPLVTGVRLVALRGIRVEGVIDFSGEDAHDIRWFLSGELQEQGGLGGPGGGRGGLGNPRPGQSNPKGGDGMSPYESELTGFGGVGGESSLSLSHHAAGGGGGGRLAADQPVTLDPHAPSNLGLVATSGFDGNVLAMGVLTPHPRGGSAGPSAFIDSNPANDFWGRQMDSSTGSILVGELSSPVGGRGGGGGGDAIHSTSFPAAPWSVGNFEKGAGAGGGGGLAVIRTPHLVIAGNGKITTNGGAGARIANPSFSFMNAGSGGGSGGMVLIQVSTLDVRTASDRAIIALGGRGGPGLMSQHDVTAAGGNGGPGILQLHMVNGPSGILLPTNKTLSDMTAPTAYVLLPEPNL